MYKKGDFHLHTSASDGNLPPSELVSLAKNQNIDILAITDHDNTLGIKDALICGKSVGIEVIPGIELSTRHNGESIHILGYFKDDSYNDKVFQNYLKEIQDYRILRAKKIFKKLKENFDIYLDFEELLKINHGVIARPHIAKAIIDAGYPYTFRYIFDNFIGDTCPAYVPNKDISIDEGLRILKSANALTCLAHPTLIKNTPVENIFKYNFDCIEAVYPLNKSGEEEKFKSLAKKYHKIFSAGSDYHGLNENDHKHGYIGDSFLEGNDLDIFLNKLKS